MAQPSGPSEPGARGERRFIVVLVICGAALVAHAFYYYPFLSDDALISLRYVQRFLGGKGLTWTDGPPVEGYSNLLWVLLTAALGGVGLDLIASVRILGLAASLGVVAAIGAAARRFTAWPASAALAGGVVWVASAPAAAWTMAGLETPLVACLVAWALVCGFDAADRPPESLRAALPLGLCLAALALTRPDGVLFTVLITAWLAARGRFQSAGLRSAARVAALPFVVVGLHLAFRHAYYGAWLPNTAHVKVNLSAKTWSNGLEYVWSGSSSLRPLFELGVASIIVLCLTGAQRARGLLLALVSVAWLTYVSLVGGDLFPAWRMLVPVLVALAIAIVLATGSALDTWLSTKRRRRAALAIGTACVGWFLALQFTDELDTRAKQETWEWHGKVIGEMLKRGFRAEQPLLAVTAAGALPYWSELPCLDMLGLNDAHIARVPVADAGARWVGHEKGDVAYVLGRKPDLIHFGSPGGSDPVFAYEQGMPAAPEFRDGYERCNYAAPLPDGWFTSHIWTNRNSPKIGIRRAAGQVRIPSYLLNLTGHAVVSLDPHDRFVVVAGPKDPVGIAKLELEAGRWQVAEPSGAFIIMLRDVDLGQDLPTAPTAPVTFDVPHAGHYDLVLVPAAKPILIHELVLQRM